jgi:hypothetical protein
VSVSHLYCLFPPELQWQSRGQWRILRETLGVHVVNHETGNIGAFPDVEVQIPKWADGPMKPWWLTPIRDSLTSRGMLGSNATYAEDTGAVWAARSARMYLFAWKDRMEAMRKTNELSGYEWWLLQDFWTTSNGESL